MLMGDNRLAIIMLGPPGAGKGTQARILSDALKLPHISTGDMLREALKNQTDLGKKIQTYMDSGSLVPDGLVDAMVVERLNQEDCVRGFLLDGYPRNLAQAQVLQAFLDEAGTKTLTIGVEVEDGVLIQRLSSRWTCPRCGKMFNAQLNLDKVNGKCDECDEPLVQRNDDKAEVIAKRLQIYHKQTQPLVRYYKEQGAYIQVNGARPIDEVFDGILNIITTYR
jgi:adenylate kinase